MCYKIKVVCRRLCPGLVVARARHSRRIKSLGRGTTPGKRALWVAGRGVSRGSIFGGWKLAGATRFSISIHSIFWPACLPPHSTELRIVRCQGEKFCLGSKILPAYCSASLAKKNTATQHHSWQFKGPVTSLFGHFFGSKFPETFPGNSRIKS